VIQEPAPKPIHLMVIDLVMPGLNGNELPHRLMSFHPEMKVLYMADYTDNADAHLKRQVMGREVVVAITEGKLDFGPWEQIFYGEFDGRRRKRVLVKIIGE
jgi:secondary thiamine-phosphate synthase enzyme